MTDLAIATPQLAKFADPDRTARGEVRARVTLEALRTLWINTGTLCNVTCRNCYIDSSPENDRLATLNASIASSYDSEGPLKYWGSRTAAPTRRMAQSTRRSAERIT